MQAAHKQGEDYVPGKYVIKIAERMVVVVLVVVLVLALGAFLIGYYALELCL